MTDRSAVQGRAFELPLAGVGETLENYEQEGGRLECALEGGEEGRGTGRGFPNGLGWSQGAPPQVPAGGYPAGGSGFWNQMVHVHFLAFHFLVRIPGRQSNFSVSPFLDL